MRGSERAGSRRCCGTPRPSSAEGSSGGRCTRRPVALGCTARIRRGGARVPMTGAGSTDDVAAGRFVTFMLNQGLAGAGPLSGAAELANEYLRDPGYKSDERRVDALVKWESRKNFSSGFLT